jgi:hypothetical protein
MPSPDRRAHEEAAEAKQGWQQRQRRQQANKEAWDAGRVCLEARNIVERAASRELELCGKRTITQQQEERAHAKRADRRRAAAEEHRRKVAGGPPNW